MIYRRAGASCGAVAVVFGCGRVIDLRRLEAVKWFAFLAMVADHVDLLLFARAVPWLHEVGAFAFPGFALTFGIGLARSADPLAAAIRIALAGVGAQVVWWLLLPGHYANVLLVFAACAAAFVVLCRSRVVGLLAWCAVAALATLGGDGGLCGVVLVAAGAVVGSGRLTDWEGRAVLLVAGAGWLLSVPMVGAAIAIAFVVFVPVFGRGVPRVRGGLLVGYPLHLVPFLLV